MRRADFKLIASDRGSSTVMPTKLHVHITENVRAIKALGRHDPEAAHSVEDKLYERVLREIAAGKLTKADAIAYATEALKTKDADFPRWSA